MSALINTGLAPSSAPWRTDGTSITLELSQSRTYDAALEALGAYKLTGNFPTELEIVLRDMRVLDMVTFEIKPNMAFAGRREVEFRPAAKVRPHNFFEVMRLVKKRLGTDAHQSWWLRLFQ